MPCPIFPGGAFDSSAAKANAQASTYYACSYLEASLANSSANTAIATANASAYTAAHTAATAATAILAAAQTAVQEYFAKKQYETQKQAQLRLDTIATEQLRVSKNLRDQYELSMKCERDQLADACGDIAAPPDYESIKLRIRAPILAQSSRRRLQATRSASVNCAAAACALNDRILVEEGRQVARAAESAYRREEQLYEVRKVRIRDFRSNVLQHMRGLSTASSSSLAGAMASTQAAAGINPYAGWAAATNAAFGRVSGLLAMNNVNSAFSSQRGSSGGFAGGGGAGLQANGVANQTNSGMTFENASSDYNTLGQLESSQAGAQDISMPGFSGSNNSPANNASFNTANSVETVGFNGGMVADPTQGLEVKRYDA